MLICFSTFTFYLDYKQLQCLCCPRSNGSRMYVFVVSVADFMYSQVSFPIMFVNGTNDSFFPLVASGCEPGTWMQSNIVKWGAYFYLHAFLALLSVVFGMAIHTLVWIGRQRGLVKVQCLWSSSGDGRGIHSNQPNPWVSLSQPEDYPVCPNRVSPNIPSGGTACPWCGRRTQTCQLSSQNPGSGHAVSLGGGGGDAMALEKESDASLFSRRQRGILGCWSKCQFPYKGLAVQWGKVKERQARFLFWCLFYSGTESGPGQGLDPHPTSLA